MTRSIQALLAEIALRKALGLPRIELTPEERLEAAGDLSLYGRSRDRGPYLAERLEQGLPLSHADRKEARRYLKQRKGLS